MTSYLEKPITVYRVVEEEVVTCSLGQTHKVKLVVRKFLGPQVDRRPHDNGYDIHMESVRRDAQGREYEARSPIDFYGSTFWVRVADKSRWDSRPPRAPLRYVEPADVGVRLTLVLGR